MFSYEEVKTNDAWVDGKPIYRKTVQLGTLPNNGMKNVNHEILNIDTIMIDTSHSFATDEVYYMPLPFVNTTATACIKVSTTKTVIAISTGEDRSDLNGFVTLLYTKTTD